MHAAFVSTVCSELLAMPSRLSVLLDCLERALAGLSLVRLPPALLVPEMVERVGTEEMYVRECEPSADSAAAAVAPALSPARAELVCEMLKLLFNVTLERARSTRSALKPTAQAATRGTPVHKARLLSTFSYLSLWPSSSSLLPHSFF